MAASWREVSLALVSDQPDRRALSAYLTHHGNMVVFNSTTADWRNMLGEASLYDALVYDLTTDDAIAVRQIRKWAREMPIVIIGTQKFADQHPQISAELKPAALLVKDEAGIRNDELINIIRAILPISAAELIREL